MTRRLSDQELRLWLRVARSVTPARPQTHPERTSHAAPRTGPASPPLKASATSTTAAQPQPSAPAPSSPAQDQSGRRRVRRGQVDIDATLDLHGHTQDTAMTALADFVQAERMNGARCLLVITGKGRAGTGVLRGRFLDWINRSEIRPHVSGYSAANARHGGDGAFYLLLKRMSRN